MALSLPEGRPGRVLAIAITLLGLMSIWTFAAGPFLQWFLDRNALIERQRVLLSRMRSVAAELPALRHAAIDTAAARPRTGALLEGATDAIAGAALQLAVGTLARQAGVTLGSTETLPAETVGAYRRIGLRVSVSASWPDAVTFLLSVAQAAPTMLIGESHLHAVSSGTTTESPRIDLTLVILAFRKADGP